MKQIFLAIASVAILASCGSEGSDKAAGTTTTPTATTPQPSAAPQQPVQVNADPAAAPGQNPTVQVQQPAVDPNVKDPNPAHGQPNHRCDIPVGASLSTPKAAAPAAGAGQPQVQVQPQAAPVKK